MISLGVALIVAGVLLWAAEALFPLDPGIRRGIQLVVLTCVLLYVLYLGLM